MSETLAVTKIREDSFSDSDDADFGGAVERFLAPVAVAPRSASLLTFGVTGVTSREAKATLAPESTPLEKGNAQVSRLVGRGDDGDVTRRRHR